MQGSKFKVQTSILLFMTKVSDNKRVKMLPCRLVLSVCILEGSLQHQQILYLYSLKMTQEIEPDEDIE